MASRYEADHEGLNSIARSPEVRAALAAVATKGKGIAEGLSADFRVTGNYMSSFEVQADTIEWAGEYPGRRAAAYLVNTADYAASVEWGDSRDHKPHHVLGRTLGMLHA